MSISGGNRRMDDRLENVRGEAWEGGGVRKGGVREERQGRTERVELCDDLVDDLLELAVLYGGLSELRGQAEQQLGVCLGEVHPAPGERAVVCSNPASAVGLWTKKRSARDDPSRPALSPGRRP